MVVEVSYVECNASQYERVYQMSLVLLGLSAITLKSSLPSILSACYRGSPKEHCEKSPHIILNPFTTCVLKS